MDDREFFRSSKARTERGLITFDIALDAAIVDRVINSPGTLFYLDKTSTGICTVEGSVDQGTTRDSLLASPGFSLFNESGFSGFRISAPAQPGKTLRIVIASGVTIKPGDPVQSGAVATPTVDAALARTNAGQAYLGDGFCSAVAAQYSHLQLWNAAANPRDLILEAVSFSVPVAASVSVLVDNAIRSTVANTAFNKKTGSPVGYGVLRSENNVAIQGTAYGLGYNMAAGVVQTVNLKEPIVIRPGYGINVVCGVVNTALSANFEWFEQ